MHAVPERSEAVDYYFTYIDQVPDADICATLDRQLPEALALFETVTEEQSLQRYGEGKWTIREVLSHINDCERLFVFRAFWFARGFDSPLPSFDQNAAMTTAAADGRPWASHVEEFRAVRSATLSFFKNLPAEAWSRRGIASDSPFSVRALAYIAAGHLVHHVKILRDRYL